MIWGLPVTPQTSMLSANTHTPFNSGEAQHWMHNKIRNLDPTRAMLEFVNGEQKVLSQRAACYRRLNKERARRTGSYVSAFNGISPAAKQKLNLYFDVSE